MSLPSLPIEVCERIIDMVGRPSVDPRAGPTLCACAVVCGAWVSRVRRNLFREIRIKDEVRVYRLLAALSHFPFLGRIAEAMIIYGPKDRLKVRGRQIQRAHLSRDWLHKAIQSFPKYLTNLRELSLFDFPTIVHPSFMHHCARFITVESLRVSSLRQSFREVIRLVNKLPRLRHLYISDCAWDSGQRFYGGKSHSLTTVSLVFVPLPNPDSRAGDIFRWLLSSCSVSTITRLNLIGIQDDKLGTIGDIILACRSTLRDIRIRFARLPPH